MYFIDDEHESNFSNLVSFFGKKANDPQYRANIYIASVPEIYKLLPKSDIHTGGGPLNLLTQYSEKESKLIPNHEGLTGSTRKLVEIGLSLFNGNEVSLDFNYGEEVSDSVLQAMKIRFSGN